MKVNFFLINIIFFVSNIYANPKEGKLISGKAHISEKQNELKVHQKSKRAVLEWKEFCINKGEKVHFVQPENGIILNKIASDTMPKINGFLKGDATVYLMNKNGLIIGKNGKVEAKGFCVIGQDIQADEFFNQKGVFKINSDAVVINKGVIKTSYGNVVLIGKEIKNEGIIQSNLGNIDLVGSSEVFLQKVNDEHVCVSVKGIGCVENSGLIKAANTKIKAAGGDIYSLAINQKGVIEAEGSIKKNGRIILSAGEGDIKVSGNMKAKKAGTIKIETENAVHIASSALIDVSCENGGGTILIGEGDQKNGTKNAKKVVIDKGSKILANAISNGNGGSVTIWAEDQNIFEGDIYAKGGDLRGDGGFVDISSPKSLSFRGKVDTTSINGKTGTLLLDPSDIVIADFGGSSTPSFPTTPPGTYDPSTSLGQLDVANLQTALATNNVNISTTAGTGGAGTVTINSDLTWSAATTLLVTANRNIILDGVSISNTNVLGGFTAVDLQAGQLGNISGNFDGIFLRNSTISSSTGNINLLARGGTFNNNYGIHLFNSSIESSGLTPNAATITIDGTGGAGADGLTGVVIESNSSVNSRLGDISITGNSNGVGNLNHGIWVFLESEVVSDGLGVNAATITLNGTSSSGVSGNFGVLVKHESSISSDTGDIDITAVSNGSGAQNMGLGVQNLGRISSVGTVASAAVLAINATSGLGQNNNRGFLIESNSIVESINGDLNIMSTSRGGGNFGNQGVVLRESSFIRSVGIGLNAADINLTGIPGSGETIGARADFSSNVTVVDGIRNITGGFERSNDL